MGMTVVIPSLGLNAMLRCCVQFLEIALDKAGLPDGRILIVDNASPHPYRAGEFGPRAEIIRMDTPQSFARACNHAAFAAPNETVFFLNNDVLLDPQAISDITQTIHDTGAAICGARLVYPNDTIQHCGVRIGGPLPAPYHEHNGKPSHTIPRHVRDYQIVTGAALAISFEVFDALGGFDEVFPFAYEDADLCLRARQLGHRISCAQAVDSIHFESQTPGRAARELGSRVIFEQRWNGRCTIDTEAGHYA